VSLINHQGKLFQPQTKIKQLKEDEGFIWKISLDEPSLISEIHEK
jgi:hypothetical protein